MLALCIESVVCLLCVLTESVLALCIESVVCLLYVLRV